MQVVAAYHVPNVLTEKVEPEGSAAINEGKAAQSDLGGYVYVYLRNGTEAPLTLEGITLNGVRAETLAGAPVYDPIWWRLSPHALPPGGEGELTICLRNSLMKPTTVRVRLSNRASARTVVYPEAPAFRITSVAFAPDLQRAYVYVEALRAAAPVPEALLLDGQALGKQVQWLGKGWTGGVRVAVVTPRSPFERGKDYTFRAVAGSVSAGATLSAFTDIARFGTYGGGDLQLYAAAGLDNYLSFKSQDRAYLEAAQQLGVQVASHGVFGVADHPAVDSQLLPDEPDVTDYYRDQARAMHLRIGTVAPEMLELTREYRAAAPTTPVMLTMDLTFTPWNYFVYGPIADIFNPDCYPITFGWQISAIREKASIARRACAPRPLRFVYQGCWEEYIRDGAMPDNVTWIGEGRVAELGRQALVDPARVRGFGRAPVPSEVRMQMLYAIGCGAKGLTSYMEATEGNGSLLSHGSPKMPEIWQAITSNSRALRLVAPLIEISHPIEWAQDDKDQVWTRTLLCGRDAALVVAVNEDYECRNEDFRLTSAGEVTFSFPRLPWLAGKQVYKVEDGRLSPVRSRGTGSGLSWSEPELRDAELYLVTADPGIAQSLLVRAQTNAPVATDEGRRLLPESYLGGVRSRWNEADGTQ